MKLNHAILTLSDTRTLENDQSGDFLQAAIIQQHTLADRSICKDNKYQIRAKISQWIADKNIQVIITTGGTGFYSSDVTPEAVLPLFDRTIDGFGELFRQVSVKEIGMASLQSRATAGIANNTLIFCLPGSPGACKTAWFNIIAPQLDNSTKPCNFVCHLLVK